jgi:hypothetical protein
MYCILYNFENGSVLEMRKVTQHNLYIILSSHIYIKNRIQQFSSCYLGNCNDPTIRHKVSTGRNQTWSHCPKLSHIIRHILTIQIVPKLTSALILRFNKPKQLKISNSNSFRPLPKRKLTITHIRQLPILRPLQPSLSQPPQRPATNNAGIK